MCLLLGCRAVMASTCSLVVKKGSAFTGITAGVRLALAAAQASEHQVSDCVRIPAEDDEVHEALCCVTNTLESTQ